MSLLVTLWIFYTYGTYLLTYSIYYIYNLNINEQCFYLSALHFSHYKFMINQYLLIENCTYAKKTSIKILVLNFRILSKIWKITPRRTHYQLYQFLKHQKVPPVSSCFISLLVGVRGVYKVSVFVHLLSNMNEFVCCCVLVRHSFTGISLAVEK